MQELLFFIFCSAGLVYISRSSLLLMRGHGFYRFIAWEILLGLFMLNIHNWFKDPFSTCQIISWFLLLISIILVFEGIRLLLRYGSPDKRRMDAGLIGFEKTTLLITSGIYRYIRHPLYSSLFFLGWGIFFKNPSWLDGILAAIASSMLMLAALAEEYENNRYFGSDYRKYMQKTRMLIPFIL
jgi:protein-S-isoprenylcysteine O-methyltransferase Ste14